MRPVFASTFTCAFLIALAPAARAAEDPKAVASRIEDQTRIALDEYDMGDVGPAEKRLQAALADAQKAKLEKSPAAAKTYVALGIVQAFSPKRTEAARDSFKAALDIDSNVPLPVKFATPQAKKIYDELKTAIDQKKAAAAAMASSDKVIGIQHIPVDAGEEGNPIAVEARIGTDLKAREVLLFFRGQNGNFKRMEMKSAGKDLVRADIPPEATATDSLRYYIQVKNAKGKLVAAKGTEAAPFVITVKRKVNEKKAAEDEAVISDDEENPLEELNRKK